MTEQFKGILFDFDGVLADTPQENYAAWCKALAVFNLTLSFHDYACLEGKKAVEISAKLLSDSGQDPIHAQSIASNKDDIYSKNNTFAYYPGVLEMVERLLAAGIMIGVVSGGVRRRLVNAVTEPLLSKFHAVVTADDCKVGKPNPEPYLKGAERLGLKPQQCLVVENAPLGLDSARNGGMDCVAICTTLQPEHLKQASKTFSSIIEFAAALNFSSAGVSFK